MPNPMLLLRLLFGVVVLSLAALLALVLAALAVAALATLFVMYKLGWDRRLFALLVMRHHNVRVVKPTPAKPPGDDLEGPLDAPWAVQELGAKGPGRAT